MPMEDVTQSDPSKQVADVPFSRKTNPVDTPPIYFNNLAVRSCETRKYLGLLTVCSYHVKYAFQNEYTLYSCLNVKELLNVCVFVYELSGCGFESSCCHSGLLLDKRLVFDHHVEDTILRANKGIALITRLSRYLLRNSLLTICKTFALLDITWITEM